MKLRFWRQEVKTDVDAREESDGIASRGPWTPPPNKNDPSTYVSEIIADKINNRDEREHQRKMALWSAVGSNICIKLANNTFDDGFEFVDDLGKKGKVIMPEIQAKLRALNATYFLTQALIMERIYGHGWVYVGRERLYEDVVDVDAEVKDRRITNLDAFGPEIAKVIEYDEDGYPAAIEIKVLKGITKTDGSKGTKEDTKRIDIEDLILLRTRPKPFERTFEGMPVLYHVWSTLWSVELAFHSSDFYLGKIGHGMFCLISRPGTSDEKVGRMQDSVEKMSPSRMLVLPGKYVESISFVNASGTPIDFPAEIKARLGIIGAGTGVPSDLLIGLSAGSITGSEVNVKALYQTLAAIQTSVEPMIRELVHRLGHKDENYFIRWITRYAHDEEQKAKIALYEAQTWAIKTGWLTPNEIRKRSEGLGPKEGGENLKSDFEVNVQGMQTAEEAEATHNEKGDN